MRFSTNIVAEIYSVYLITKRDKCSGLKDVMCSRSFSDKRSVVEIVRSHLSYKDCVSELRRVCQDLSA